jgi:hypothetical protein
VRPRWGATCQSRGDDCFSQNIAHHSCSVAPNFCAQCELFARAHFLVHSIIDTDFYWSTPMLTGLGILAALIFIAFSAVRASQR